MKETNKISGKIIKCVEITTESITLLQFLKWIGLAGTGGAAKQIIESEAVMVNGLTETVKGKKLIPGDIVTIENFGNFKVIKNKYS